MKNTKMLLGLNTFGTFEIQKKALDLLDKHGTINYTLLRKTLCYDDSISKKVVTNSILFLIFTNVVVVHKGIVKISKVLNDRYKKISLNKLLFIQLQETIKYFIDVEELIKYQYDVEANRFLLTQKINLKFSHYRDYLISLEYLIFDKSINEYAIIHDDVIDVLNRKNHSLEQLKRGLERKEFIGNLGEEFVLMYENNRLQNKKNIKRISEIDCNAGYDIVSYNSAVSLFFDRFIEVKTYTSFDRIFLTKNEMKIAEELQNQYYLYLVDFEKIKDVLYEPYIICNPFDKLIHNEYIEKRIELISCSVKDIFESI